MFFRASQDLLGSQDQWDLGETLESWWELIPVCSLSDGVHMTYLPVSSQGPPGQPGLNGADGIPGPPGNIMLLPVTWRYLWDAWGFTNCRDVTVAVIYTLNLNRASGQMETFECCNREMGRLWIVVQINHLWDKYLCGSSSLSLFIYYLSSI